MLIDCTVQFQEMAAPEWMKPSAFTIIENPSKSIGGWGLNVINDKSP